MLGTVTGALNDRRLAPLTARLDTTDTGRSFQLDAPTGAPAAGITGSEAEILAWLIGRSGGERLSRDTPGPLPPLPSIYHT